MTRPLPEHVLRTGVRDLIEASLDLKHRRSRHPLYMTWCSMNRRCTDSRNIGFQYYGGRGIRVCDRWRLDFVAFVIDMGPKPSSIYTLDRIDNNGNYESSNCRWASSKEQAANRPMSEAALAALRRGHDKAISLFTPEMASRISRMQSREATARGGRMAVRKITREHRQLGNHRRWHLGRGIVNPKCQFCAAR